MHPYSIDHTIKANHKLTMLSFCFLFFLLFLVIHSLCKKIAGSKLTLLRVHRPKGGTASIEHLPQELVSKILSRLPAKVLLLQCKCVCKSWYNLITDANFIANYYVVYNNLMQCDQTQEAEHFFVIRRPFLSSIRTYISVLSSFKEPKLGHVSSNNNLNPPYEYNSDHKYWTEILGPCDGIYFLEGNPYVMMNPSLGQLKALPESHLCGPHGTYSLTDYAGFGFDSKTNDYKVVVIKDVWLKKTDERQVGYWTVELYSLNFNTWRKLDDADLPHPIEIWGYSRVYTYVNNCCHWWGFVHESGKKKDVVLAFDMVYEVFRKVKVPRIRESSKEAFATLVPFEESATIGVIVYPARGKEKRYDVWVMKDYWDEGSWIKQYSVGPVEMIYKVVGLYGSHQFLWMDSNQGLVLYESDSQQIKDLKIYGKNDSLRAARYMESLVSLQRGNEFRRQLVSCSLVPDPLLNERE